MEATDILDSPEEIKKIDQENVLGSVDALSDQCKDAWEKASVIEVPESYKDISNIVMCGMGGSGLGARVIESVFTDNLKVPLTRVNDYDLPFFTDHHSLVVCSSYSGNTEETVQNARQAVEKKAKWLAIGKGNTLIDMASEYNVPYYKIEPQFNPSNQPRMAIGYSVIGQLVMASKAGIIDLIGEDIYKLVIAMGNVRKKCSLEVPYKDNPAKKLAGEMKDKIIMYVASGHLVGAMHTVNNQLNENAKNVSFDVQIPELNHHLMEGLKHPLTNKSGLFVFFAKSGLYSERIKTRFTVTEDVVKQNNINYSVYTPSSQEKLSQAFELIQFGAYVNFYLAMLYGQNPAPIPWVDYFKVQMGQPLGK